MVETQADGSEGSCEESNSIDVNSDGDSDEIQTQEMDYGPLSSLANKAILKVLISSQVNPHYNLDSFE